MINLRNAKRIVIIGGGTEGWFAALTFRRIAAPEVEVLVLEDPGKGIIGVGEGGLLSLPHGLRQNGINLEEFIKATDATIKLGISYEGWRTGAPNDIYYHLFHNFNNGIEELEGTTNRTYPLLAGRIAAGLDMFSFLPGFSLLQNNATQAQANIVLASNKSGLSPSFHFDSHKLAEFLKSTAKAKNIKHKHLKVEEFVLDDEGNTIALKTAEGDLEVDFVVDASGLRRIGIGETYKQKWRSFSDQLILDRAIPFPIKHPKKNPALYTRSIAMNAGWMWQIPLVERTGAGYVFSSKHIDENEAVKEAEAYLGHSVEPRSVIRFEPGNFENVWCKNVLAVGLASGFVEPLAATSIGQMLRILRRVENMIVDGHGIVGDNAIEAFNQDSLASWNEIRDFLRMHYDTIRQDTSFWQDVHHLPRSESYKDICDVMKKRLPRVVDIESYISFNWPASFEPTSWIMVGAAVGVIPPQSGYDELATLPKPIFDQVQQYLMRQKQLLSQ